MTAELGYEFWICRECLLVSGSPDDEHEHGALTRGYWVAADTRPGEMSVAEFRAAGYLQEVNRRLLHPLGLALISTTLEGWEVIVGVRDDRSDPEGLAYAPGTIPEDERRRADVITREWVDHSSARLAALGYVVQPIEDC